MPGSLFLRAGKHSLSKALDDTGAAIFTERMLEFFCLRGIGGNVTAY
jgi:hypothetical protein